MWIPFWKVEGLTNDFVLVDARAQVVWIERETAIRWCDRRRGIGADGVLTLLPDPDPAVAGFMHIYNADGSEPEMCGNGLRCALLHLSRSEHRIPLRTPAGLRAGRVTGPGRVRTSLGLARVEGRVSDHGVDEAREAGWRVSLGNPHLVLWVDVEPRAAAAAHGARLERHPAFPQGVNVGFARKRPGAIELVVHERGAGLTGACGTGAAAAAVSSVARGEDAGPVTVHLPGGACEVSVEAAGEGFEVVLEGPARVAFRGEVEVAPGEVRSETLGRLLPGSGQRL